MKAFLRGLRILSDLSDEEIELLARTAEERSFPADHPIVRRGDPGNAAFILQEGTAEALIEKPGSKPLRLSKVIPGEMFGELALFDGSPRSATVMATTDCTVVEIKRDAFLREVTRNPAMALRLLSVVAQRLRRAESVVSDFSDRIYGDVLPRLQEAVAAQLETAKIICQESRSHTESTIAQARHIQETVDKHWSLLTRVGTVVGILLVVLGSLAGWFGYSQLDKVVRGEVVQEVERKSEKLNQTIRAELDEVRGLKRDTELAKKGTTAVQAAAEQYLEDVKRTVKEDLRDLEVMRQTTLEFDKMRRDLQLEGGSAGRAPSEITGDAARDFVAARASLVSRYLEKPRTWESQILIEALELLVAVIEDGYMTATREEWDAAIDTVVEALKNPPEHWRQRTKLNELAIRLYELMVAVPYKEGGRALIRRLEAGLESGSLSSAAASQTATILAALGSSIEPVKTELSALLAPDVNRWRRTRAAVDLVLLGEAKAWETLRSDLAAQFLQGSAGEYERTTQVRQMDAFVAAYRLIEGADAAYIAARRPERHLKMARLDQELSSAQLARQLDPDPWADKPTGADLVGYTVLQGLTRDPDRWGHLYWHHTCRLLCKFGCKLPGATDGGQWCRSCFGAFEGADKLYGGNVRGGEAIPSCDQLSKD